MTIETLKGRYSAQSAKYQSKNGPKGSPTVKNGVSNFVTDRQVIRTRGNPVSLLGIAGFDIGGPFGNSRVTIEGGRELFAERTISAFPEDVYVSNKGFYFASSEAASLATRALTTAASEQQWMHTIVPPVGDLTMLAAGSTAISRVAPTNPCVDLSTALAELFREGLPTLPGRGGNGFGGEYLNYQFGIAPLVGDIVKLRDVASRADALWDQYAKNSGKRIRRRYEFEPEVVTTTSVSSFAVPANPQLQVGATDGFTGNLVQPGTLFRRTTTTKRTWFSGAFTYYLPDSPIGAAMDRLDYLYGIRPGVDTLYQLTPWSWLVDYFTNLGDVVENLNSFTSDGLVMPYAYVMSETTSVTESRLNFRIWEGKGWKDASLTDSIIRKTQKRMPASPFGFGVSDGSLTAKQWSILAALGLTRR